MSKNPSASNESEPYEDADVPEGTYAEFSESGESMDANAIRLNGKPDPDSITTNKK